MGQEKLGQESTTIIGQEGSRRQVTGMIPLWGRSHSQGEAIQCSRKGNDENDDFKYLLVYLV